MRVAAAQAILLGIWACSCLYAADGNPASKLSVEQWIERLGSPSYREREAALQALTALGSEALPALRKAQNHIDPEVRRRLADLIPTLEAQATFAPKLVNLKLVNRSLKDILHQLSEQTGYKVQLSDSDPNRERLVYSFDFEQTPFWVALDKICETAGLALQQHYYGDDILRLYEVGQNIPFVHHNGAFRIVPTGFYYTRSLSFNNFNRVDLIRPLAAQENLNLSIILSVEPRLPLLQARSVRLIEVLDDEGNSMVPIVAPGEQFGMQRFYYGGGNRSFSQQVGANLLWPSKKSRHVRLLRGLIPVTLLTEQKPLLIVENVLKAPGKSFQTDGITLDVEQVTELPQGALGGNGKGYSIKLSLRDNRQENPHDHSWVQTLQQRIELQDAKGNKYGTRSYHWNESSPTQVKGAQFSFSPDPSANVAVGPPHKLIYYVWVKRDHEVTFEFRDLPLP